MQQSLLDTHEEVHVVFAVFDAPKESSVRFDYSFMRIMPIAPGNFILIPWNTFKKLGCCARDQTRNQASTTS